MIRTKSILLLLLFSFSMLHALDLSKITGKWYTATRVLNQGTETIEKEHLTLYPNGNFQLILLVSVKRDLAYIKDLRIEVSGTWEARDALLIYVIKHISIPTAKDVYMINQASLENVAETFKQRYQNDTIHINDIKVLKDKELILVNKKGRKSSYKR